MKKLFTLIIALILIGGNSFAQTWQPVNNSGTSFILYGMSFPPNQNDIGFACGMKYTWDADGVIVKTTDGGDNWEQVWPTSGTISGLEGIWFINDQLGFAGGWNNYFIKTTDGGATWTEVSCGTNVFYYVDVVFHDENNGVAAGMMEGESDQAIFITSDGGNTWLPATSGTQVDIQSVCYADDVTLFAVGTGGDLLKSIDGGHNWNIQASPGGTLVGVDFADRSFGVVGAEANIHTTKDGGETWTTTTTGYEFFFGVKAFENGTAYVAGDDNIWMTTDFGETFVPDHQGNYGDATFYRVRSTPNGNLFASGSGGTILKKTMPLTANFTADYTTVCNGGTVNFSDLSSGMITTWNWTFEGGDPATSTEQNPSVIYNTPGTYDVSLEVGDGTNINTVTATDMITVDDCTGIIENGIAVYNIYPNPGADVMHINIRVEKGENYTLTLRNLLGQTIRTVEGNGTGMDETLSIGIDDIPQGQYIMGITTTSGVFSYSKFIVAR